MCTTARAHLNLALSAGFAPHTSNHTHTHTRAHTHHTNKAPPPLAATCSCFVHQVYGVSPGRLVALPTRLVYTHAFGGGHTDTYSVRDVKRLALKT